MDSISKLIICGDFKQVEKVRRRVKPSIESIVSANLLDDQESFDTLEDSNGCCFVAVDEQQANMIKKLVPKVFILHYYLFEDTTYDYPCQQFSNATPGDIEELIFGMSHSECGITDNYLKKHHCLKFSLPSLDLFLQYKSFEKLCVNQGNSFANVNTVTIELPYYIFNYDLSRFGSFVLTKLNYFKSVEDYHHFGEKKEQKRLIEQFELFMNLFTAQIKIGGTPKRKRIILRLIKYLSFVLKSQWQAIKNNDSVWTKIRDITIEENINYWKSFLSTVRKACPNAQITVMIMPFNPLFRWSHKKNIKVMKNVFYDIMKSATDIKVVDNFDMYSNMFLFEDHCHLNKRGAKLYTSMILK